MAAGLNEGGILVNSCNFYWQARRPSGTITLIARKGGGPLNRFIQWVAEKDTAWFHFFNRTLKCRPLDVLMPRLTHLGGPVMAIGSLLAALFLTPKPYRMWVVEALISLSVSHVFVHFVKKYYRRKRPYDKLQSVHMHTGPLRDFSFPSGHTTAAFSIAVVFALHSLLLALLLVPLAALVAVSRMYLGLHYPSDCMAGALIGTLSSCLIVMVF